MMNSSKKRDISLDMLKGILILLVVLGHSIADTWEEHNFLKKSMFELIYSFHMPLFIMVSGYFFYSCLKYDFWDLLLKKAKRLMLPWGTYSIITVLVFFTSKSYSFSGGGNIAMTALEIYRIFMSLWFLPCVFVLSLFYYSVYYIKKDGPKRLIGFASIMLFVFIFIRFAFFNYSQNLVYSILTHCQIVGQSFAFGVGILLYRYKDSMSVLNKIFLPLFIFVILFDRVVNGMWITQYPFLTRVIDGVSSGYVVYSITMPFLKKKAFIKGMKFLAYFGSNSLGIYCVHQVLRGAFTWNNMFTKDVDNRTTIVYFVALLTLSLIIIEIIKYFSKSKSCILGI